MSRYDKNSGPGAALPIVIAQGEMRPRERVIWAERPVSGSGRKTSFRTVGFGLLFAGFAAFWTLVAYALSRASNGPVDWISYLFPFFGIPFFLVGITVAFSPLFAGRKTGSLVYALSNERILIIRNTRWRQVRSFDLVGIHDVERNERADGSGDILFRTGSLGKSDAHSLLGTAGLFGVANVRRVGEEIDRALRRARDDAEHENRPFAKA